MMYNIFIDYRIKILDGPSRMKEEYVLYLDESEFKNSKTFAIAGIAVKKENINALENGMKEIKELIWDEEYVIKNNPILHCTEFQKVYNGRNYKNINGVKEEYKELIKLPSDNIDKIYNQVYGKMSATLKKANATVFSCIIKMKQLIDLFSLDETHNGCHLIDDKYNIALQKIIENYTHYLSVNDGCGDVVYESRNNVGENSPNSPDIKLINDYHKIQANNKGIVYTKDTEIQTRNRTITTYLKNENIAGLQIADFVAYNIIKLENCNVDNQITDFMKLIHRLSYNGGQNISEKDQRSFWGMRVLPSYLKMDKLETSNKSLKNAYNNLKKERNSLKKIIEQDNNRINDLEEQIIRLKSDLENVEKSEKSIDMNPNN